MRDKLERMNKYNIDKDNRKKKRTEKINNENNYNKSYINNNNIDDNNINNPLSRNRIEEKEEEYINSLNNKLQISKEKENRKTEENENIEMELSNKSSHEKSIQNKPIQDISNIEKKKEENISYSKIEKENELEKKEIKEKIDNLYSNNFEVKDNLLEIKNKNNEIKNEKEKTKKKIRIQNTNFINNVNKVDFKSPKYTINAKLNFNYYSVNNYKEEKNNKTENEEINQINYNNLNVANELKEKYQLFYDYGTSASIHTVFQRSSINNNLNKLEGKKENYNIKEIENKKKQEKQFQREIATKKEEKKENNNTFSSFNFGFIKKDNSYYKKKILREYLMNDMNDINKENINNNEINSHNNLNKNNIENKRDLKEKKLTKDSSIQNSKEIFDKNNKSYLPLKDYIKNSEYNNSIKNKLKNECIKCNNLFDFEGFKTNYKLINKQTEYNKEDKKFNNEIKTLKTDIKFEKINNFPHHNILGRNKWTLWNEYSNNTNTNRRKKIGNNLGFFSTDKTNKFNRKLNSSVLPANPFDSISKAREYFFFND